MDGFDEIQNMWLQQPLTHAPQAEEIHRAIKKYKAKTNRAFIIEISLFFVALVVFIYLLFWVPGVTVTTRIGILFFLASIFYGAYLKTRPIRKNKQMLALSAKDFIAQLEKEKLETCTGSANEQARAFLLLCVAYVFYIYGWLSQNITALLMTYGAIAIILALLWFVLRPYSAKKRQKTIQSLITKLEQIKNEEL
jgi:hypothetical protein